jgi:thiamine pyrophosphokinase
VKGILFTGGAAPDYRFIKKELKDADIIVAADSGFDTALKMGIKPDFVIGDMDSVQHSELVDSLPSEQVFRYPEDKDETDTELGVRYLAENNYKEIVLIGGGGGRVDHFLGLVFLFDRDLSPKIWYTHNARLQLITGSEVVSSMNGRTVSFFPAGAGVCRMQSTGLKWPLNHLIWKKGNTGISNLVIADPFQIDVFEGKLIMVNQLEEADY